MTREDHCIEQFVYEEYRNWYIHTLSLHSRSIALILCRVGDTAHRRQSHQSARRSHRYAHVQAVMHHHPSAPSNTGENYDFFPFIHHVAIQVPMRSQSESRRDRMRSTCIRASSPLQGVYFTNKKNIHIVSLAFLRMRSRSLSRDADVSFISESIFSICPRTKICERRQTPIKNKEDERRMRMHSLE